VSGVLQGPIKPDVRLWRIEHPADGYGPFAAYDANWNQRGWWFTTDWADDTPLGYWAPNPHRMPAPHREAVLRRGVLPFFDRWADVPHIAFGFVKASDILRWFCGRAIRDLTTHGYVVRTLRVPWEHVQRLEHQARYDRTKATVLSTMSPVDLCWSVPTYA
jgi:hypothetical protein